MVDAEQHTQPADDTVKQLQSVSATAATSVVFPVASVILNTAPNIDDKSNSLQIAKDSQRVQVLKPVAP